MTAIAFVKSAAVAPARTAARVLADQLLIHGVEHVFCAPGESFQGVLDALRDSSITITTCRNEAGAAMMAEAVGKATGRPGVCFVTRGPGAANAIAGVHVAHQDSTPMILFVGQVDLAVRGREAFQEMDYRAVFSSLAKWATEIEDPRRVSEIVSRAFSTACAGRPGPVVVALPGAVMATLADPPDAPPFEPVEASPGTPEMEALERLLGQARRPFLILGGSRWDERACAAAARFAQRFALPVATSYRRAPLFDALHPCYAGDLGIGANPRLIDRIKRSDLVIALGGRLGEVASQGYGLLEIPGPATKLVHIHPAAEELGRVYAPHLAILASPKRAACALARLEPPASPPWREETERAHQDYRAWSEAPAPQAADVDLAAIMIWLRGRLTPESILANGAGDYAAWIDRFYRFRRFGTHFAPLSDSMGYGVPAAIAVKRLYPDRQVVSINGDGDFLVNGQEFAAAVQHRLPIVFLVLENATRKRREDEFPGRPATTALANPDFAALARAYAGFGATVQSAADFPAAFEAAEASGLPALVHVRLGAEGAAPTTTLSAIRLATAP